MGAPSEFATLYINYIFTKTVNKFNLIIFLSLLMGNLLKTTSVNLYFPPGNFLVNKFD